MDVYEVLGGPAIAELSTAVEALVGEGDPECLRFIEGFPDQIVPLMDVVEAVEA